MTDPIFDALPVAAWIVDPTNRAVLVANSAAKEQGALACGTGDDPLAGATVVDGSGRTRPLSARLAPLQHQGRAAWLVVESGSGAREARILAAVPDLWFLLDDERRYLEVSNENDPRLVGSWPDAIGRRFREVLPGEVGVRAEAAMDRARALQRVERLEYELDLPDGRHATFDARTIPLPDGGWLYLTRDISELRAAEQRFRAMADAAPIGIFMTDAAGTCVYSNHQWQTLYALTADEALGHGWALRVHPDDLPRVQAQWTSATTSAVPFIAEFRLLRPDGTEAEVRARSHPIFDGEGRNTGHVGAVDDLGDERRLARAEEASRAKTDFLSRMSHELRTPLNAILGFGQLLEIERAAEPKRAVQQAGQIVAAGRLMLSMIEDLLELQAIESGRATVQLRDVELRPLVAQVCSLLVPLAAPRGIGIEHHVPAHLTLATDERRLQQILVNLGSNAVKYNRPAGLVRMLAEMDGDGLLAIAVEDGGDGMNPEQLARLFQPFERLGRERSAVPGTGLGLAISRQLAQMLGGELTIDSTPGVGTRVVLRLPVR